MSLKRPPSQETFGGLLRQTERDGFPSQESVPREVSLGEVSRICVLRDWALERPPETLEEDIATVSNAKSAADESYL